jgi:protein O-mannosyl-transferase
MNDTNPMAQPKQKNTIKKKTVSQKKEQPEKDQKKNLYYLLIISVLALLLYLPSLSYKFTKDDDTALVKDNYEFLSKASSIPAIFSQSVFYNTFKVSDNYYRPVLIMSFFYDTQIAGKHYWFFYMTNVLLHLTCCILLFFLLQKLSFDRMKSFLFTALFAVHPAIPQAVAWLPGRNDTLLTLFALSSFLFLIEYCNKKKIIPLLLHAFFLLVSLFTKESAIFLPVVFLLYILLWRNEKSRMMKKIGEYKSPIILWLIIVAFSLIIRKSVLSNTVGFPLSFVISNFFTNLPAIIQYIGKMLLPLNLNTQPVLQDVPLYYGIIVILLTSFLVWKSKTKNVRHIIFGILWMLTFLAPSILRTSDSIETLFLEHRLYFPIIGFFIIWGETDFIKKFRLNDKSSLYIFIPILILFFSTAWIHREDYKDEYNFWKSAIDGSPHSSVALRGMAAYYHNNKQPEKAEKLYIQCLQINPDITEARNNLGRIYMDRGDDTLAEKFFFEEIDVNPRSSMAFYNLGHIRFGQGKYDEAEQMMRKSLEIDSSDVVVKNDLAACLAMQAKYEEAVILCISILDEYPKYEYPKDYISKIFSVWDDKEKITFYKNLLSKKGISF